MAQLSPTALHTGKNKVSTIKLQRLLSKGNLFCRRLLIFLEFLIDNLLHALAFWV